MDQPLEKNAQILDAQVQQVPYLRQVGRVSAPVLPVPHLFQGAGMERYDPRR
jgi:hypothetical protein